MADSRAATSGEVNWFLVVPGVVLIGLAAAVGYLPTFAYDSSCGGVFNDPSFDGPCGGVHTAPAVAVGVIGVVGVGLLVFGLAGRVRGGRLVVAGILIGGIWLAAVAGTSTTVHRGECGSLTTPASWTGYPVSPGPWLPGDCPAQLDTRRVQVGALSGAAVVMLGSLVVVVRRAPAERTVPGGR
jgi:hypothetical protein